MQVGSERHLMCIEDPFDLSHDLGRTIDNSTAGVFKRELARALNILTQEQDPAALLFERYRA